MGKETEGSGVSEAIKLFVGADGTNCDLESQAVLEWSVRKNTTRDVDIVWMQQAATGPYSGWKCASGRTPFSHFRHSIPAMCDFKGRGIYLDSDFVLMADIGELWDQPIPNVMLTKKSSKPHGKLKMCSILWDCEKAKGHVPGLDRLKQMDDPQGTLHNYFKDNDHLVDRPQGDWNAIDAAGYSTIYDPRVKAIHYSRMSTQVQLKHCIPRLAREGKTHWYTGEIAAHPMPELQELFDKLLVEATENGYGIERYRVDAFGGATRKNFTYDRPTKGAA